MNEINISKYCFSCAPCQNNLQRFPTSKDPVHIHSPPFITQNRNRYVKDLGHGNNFTISLVAEEEYNWFRLDGSIVAKDLRNFWYSFAK
jgi:hypothetical protein